MAQTKAATPTEYVDVGLTCGALAMKIQHYDRFDIMFAPAAAEELLKTLDAVPSSRLGVKFEIDVRSNPRFRDGFFTAFGKDVAALRSLGCVVDGVLSEAGKQALARGKIIDNRPPAQQETLVSKPEEIAEKKAAAPKSK